MKLSELLTELQRHLDGTGDHEVFVGERGHYEPLKDLFLCRARHLPKQGAPEDSEEILTVLC